MDKKDKRIRELELLLAEKENLGNIVDVLLTKLSQASDPDQGLGEAFDMITQTYGWDRMDYFGLDGDSGKLFIKVSTAKNGTVDQRFGMNEGIVGKVLARGEHYLTNDVANDPNFLFYRQQDKSNFQGKSYLAVPINLMGRTIGVITFLASREISEADARVAEDTLRFVTPYLQLVDSHNKLKNVIEYNEQLSIDNLTHQAVLLDTMNPYTAGHSVRVTDYANHIAILMGLDPKTSEHIQLASIWHDIGKRRVSSEIIKKPGTLSAGQIDEMKFHPIFGYEIIEPMLTVPEPVKKGVKYHHEWYGGSNKGYPTGKSHSELDHNPMITGVVSLADAWDAMNSERPYRKPIAIEGALTELRKNRGTQFNPEVVDAFMDNSAEMILLTKRLMRTNPDNLNFTNYITRLQTPFHKAQD
ncbi:MAG: HD domain-containing protein [Nanoarchaeota archaeon]|nr:HD domain-containing protein [Nanoarchaeota archaeon]